MKIGLYAHGGSGNHGCEALVRSTMQLLGEHNYTIFSERPDEDFFYHLNEEANVLPSQTDMPKGMAYLRYVVEMHLRKDDILYFKQVYRHFGQRVRNLDIALAIGGDNYCYKGFTERFALQNKALQRNKVPTVLWGCSIDPERINETMLNDLRSYRMITARESITYDALCQVGLTNVELTVDTAFSLQSTELPLPEGFIEGNTVGLNISPLIMRQEKKKDIIMQNCRHLIDYILSTTDMSVALIPHVIWQGNDDRIPLLQLHAEYTHTGRVVMIDDHDASTLKGFIRRCRFLVAARTHASIAGYSTGVPTLVIGYSVKSRGIAKDLFGTDQGYVIPVYSITNANTLTTSFGWLMERETMIRSHYHSVLPQYIGKLTPIKSYITLLGQK